MTTRRAMLLGGAGAALWAQGRKLRVAVVGGHPDDPESGCGGTMARYADAGHEVAAVYLTRGEAGIRGKAAEQAAAIRTREAEAACRILRARAVFADQVDGATEVNAARYASFAKLLASLNPDVVFAQWPIDTHRDHRAASSLAFDAWRGARGRWALYYYEVMTGAQTQGFAPTDYVDITTTEKRKREACYAHASQDPADFYGYHAKMNEFRGLEAGVKYAEAFVRQAGGAAGALP